MTDQPKPAAAFDLGLAAHQAGRLAEALGHYDQFLALQPDHAGALGLKGVVLFQTGEQQEALRLLKRAVGLAPKNPTHRINLGQALIGIGELGDAIKCYRAALKLEPDAPEALRNLSDCLRMTGRPGEAIAVSRRATEVAPGMVGGWNNLASSQMETGEIAAGLASFRRALEIDGQAEGIRSNLLYALNYDPDIDAVGLCAAHCDWDRHHRAAGPAGYANDPAPKRRLRVGYVSPDFRSHSVSYFLEPLFTHHDRASFEIFAYSAVRHADDVTQRFQELADHWCDILLLDNDTVAERIVADGIDILVDLAGHTGGNRMGIFARKPAPVQVTWLGYPTTTGASAIDYRVTDAVVDPAGVSEDWGCETPLRLESGFLCYGGPREAPDVGPLPARNAGQVTLGSFNHMPKINPPLIALVGAHSQSTAGQPFAGEKPVVARGYGLQAPA